MKKKLSQQDAPFLFKKRPMVRHGLLLCALVTCFAVTVFHKGMLVRYMGDSKPDSGSDDGPDSDDRARSSVVRLGEKGPDEAAFGCDRLDTRTDVCLLRGDVHVITGSNSSVVLYSPICEDLSSCARVEMIRPYPRKFEPSIKPMVQAVALKCNVNDSGSPTGESLESYRFCNATQAHSVPAVLFSSAGFTGNTYHELNEIFIPLFIVSQHLKGQVVLVINEFKHEWVERWSKVLHQYSNYPLINLQEDSGHHCFPEVLAGLYIHRELGVAPSLMPNGGKMEDFQRLLYEALASPELKQSHPDAFATRLQTRMNLLPRWQSRRPTLLIVARHENRILINLEEIVELAKELGFDVKVVEPSAKDDLQTVYGWFHSSDVLLGVHGAAFANIAFMRRRAVVVQIVGLGLDWPSTYYYGIPAALMGLQYIEYKIQPEESSLSEKYGLQHSIVQNPEEHGLKGFAIFKQLYLTEQSVRLSVSTFRTTLMTARSKALNAFPS